MTDKYITSSQYREGLNSIKEYIDKSIPHIGYPVIFTLSADKVLEIYNSTNHEMEFDKPSSIDLNKEIIMTYNNEDIISENSLDNYIRYKNNNIAISFHIGYDINKNTNENKMVITIVGLNTNITSDLILKQREDKYLNNKYLKKDVAIQNSITIGTRLSGNSIGHYSFTNGERIIASGIASHAEGQYTKASGDYSHAEGGFTEASGSSSHAEGEYTTASGDNSHAEGSTTTASNYAAHAEGANTTASGEYSHAEGNSTTASGESSHAEGNRTKASGVYSHAEGMDTDALSASSHAEGWTTVASGDYSHSEGYFTKASSEAQHVQGQYNIEDTKNKYAHIVGNGTNGHNSNAHTLDWAGNAWFAGKVTQEGTPTDDKDLATKKYVDDAKASIVVPNKTSELTNDSGFLTSIPEEYVTETKLTSKGYLTEHQSLDGYAKTEYVDSKTTLEETIFEGVASDTLNDYWTHCSLVDGEGCWVIDKEVIIGENIENPYYIEINGTDIYSPENSTYDATNKAWLYDHTMDNGKKLFICANYENQNKMVVPWDGMGSYDKLKIFTRTELGKKIEEQQQHSINKLATKEKPVFIGNISMGRKKGSTIGGYSVAIGYDITASGYASHAEGDNTVASGNQSHAEGERTTASGYNSHAEGYKTIASNTLSHAEGNSTTASGYASHAEGDNTVASGDHSHAEGNNTISSSENQHVQGKYNIEDKDNKYAHIVGNGSNNSTRSNAHTLDWNGNAWYAGKLSQEGNPTEDKDLATKKYVDDAKASIVVPTKTSELTNDSNFLTKHQSLTNYATIEYVDSKLTTDYVSKEELTESTKPADTTTVKTTLNDILGGDYIE